MSFECRGGIPNKRSAGGAISETKSLIRSLSLSGWRCISPSTKRAAKRPAKNWYGWRQIVSRSSLQTANQSLEVWHGFQFRKISNRPDSCRPEVLKTAQASRPLLPSRVPQASRLWTPWGCPESPDRPEQTTVQTMASVQSKNWLNYTVCYTSIKTMLRAA